MYVNKAIKLIEKHQKVFNIIQHQSIVLTLDIGHWAVAKFPCN